MKLFDKRFRSRNNLREPLYGSPELSGKEPFDPADNVTQDIYGPPEMLGALQGSPDDAEVDINMMPEELPDEDEK